MAEAVCPVEAILAKELVFKGAEAVAVVVAMVVAVAALASLFSSFRVAVSIFEAWVPRILEIVLTWPLLVYSRNTSSRLSSLDCSSRDGAAREALIISSLALRTSSL